MKRSPLLIYFASLAGFALLIGIVFVIVDINERLKPMDQTLFEASAKTDPTANILSVTAWEYDRSGTVEEPYGQKNHYKPSALTPGKKVLIESSFRYYSGGSRTDDSDIIAGREPNPYAYLSAYADDAEITVKYSLPISYWGKPCNVKDFIPDNMNYAGEKPDIRRRDSLMIYARTNEFAMEESYLKAQTDENGKPLYYSTRTEKLLEVCGITGKDGYATRDVCESTLVFYAFDNSLSGKMLAYAKIRITNYSGWHFSDVGTEKDYIEKLKSLGIADDLDNYGYAVAELIEYWQNEDI